MSDIRCVVCGEPFNAWGVNHGDMAAWETDLFRKGAGCPCCLGVKPAKGFEPQSIADLENGDEDPMQRIIALEEHEAGRAPKWEEPKDEVLQTCDGCGVQLIRAINMEVYDGDKREKVYAWKYPPDSRAARDWYVSHSAENMGPAEEAADPEEFNWTPWDKDEPEDKRRKACPCCQQTCSKCDNKIAVTKGVEPDDTVYGEGASFPLEQWRNGFEVPRVCSKCYFDKICSECEQEYGEGDGCEACNPKEPEEEEDESENVGDELPLHDVDPNEDVTACATCKGDKWIREDAVGEVHEKSELVQCPACKGTGVA